MAAYYYEGAVMQLLTMTLNRSLVNNNGKNFLPMILREFARQKSLSVLTPERDIQ